MRKRLMVTVLTLMIVGALGVGFNVFFPSVSATFVEGNISEDTTWTLVDSPFVVINDVIVDDNVTLTIEPSVEVRFGDGFSLIVDGSLYAVGTADNMIMFTSNRLEPSAGVWNTIKFSGEADEFFTIKYCVIRYATNGITVSTSQGMASLEKSEISNNSESGIMLVGKSNVVIKENIIKQNKNGIATDAASTHSGIVVVGNTILSNQQNGIYLYSNSDSAYIFNVTVSFNTVSSNGGGGIFLQSLSSENGRIYNITVVSNTVSSNNGTGIALASHGRDAFIYNVTVVSNTVSSNGGEGIYISSYGRTSAGRPYIYNVNVSSNMVAFNGANGIYLSASTHRSYGWTSYFYNVTVLSNVVSSNGVNGIYLYSYAVGQSYFYDVNVLSNVVSSNGADGIHISSSSSPVFNPSYIYNVTILSNTVSLNDGNGIYLYSYGGSAYIYNVTVVSNTVSSNGGDGVYIEASKHHTQLLYDLVIWKNTISANYQTGIGINGGINANLSRNSISYNMYGVFYTTTKNNLAQYNDIYRNSYGMNVASGATVNAEYNYWGDTSGPYHESLNPTGKGNSVNGNGVDLDFIPWLSAPVGYVNQRPVAALSVDKTTVAANQTVTFDASASTDDGRVDKYFFDFGDGTNSGWTTLSVVKHNYTLLGVYTANLTVMDDFGVHSNNTATQTITVTEEELPSLTVSLTLNPTTVNSGDQITVEALVTNGTTSVENAFVQLVSDQGGTFTSSSGYTDSNGNFTTTFTAPTVIAETNVRITATASKTGFNDGSDYKYLRVLPLGAPTLSVTVTANPTTIPSTETSTITVQVTDGTAAVTDALVQLSSDQGGTFTSSSGYTDSNGNFTTTFTAPSVTEETNVRITATASKSGYIDGSNYVDVTVFAPAAASLSVTVTANPSTIQSGETSTITVQVTDGTNPVSDATVTISSDKGGTLSPQSGTTNTNGYLTSTFTAPSVTTQTTTTITATATKTAYSSGQDQTQITVNPTTEEAIPPPTIDLFVIGLGAIVLIVVVAIAVALKRR